MIVKEQSCPLCDGGKRPVKSFDKVIVCPMCKDEGKVTPDDKEKFFWKLMKRKAMYYAG